VTVGQALVELVLILIPIPVLAFLNSRRRDER